MLTQEQIEQLRSWWHIFKHDGDLVELRYMQGKKTLSGYYRDINNIIRDVDANSDYNIYFTVNDPDQNTYGRPQCEQVKLGGTTTQDKDIIHRSWVFVDFDCNRPKDTNSTDEQKEAARKVAGHAYNWLVAHGISQPVVVDSGNGYHLYIPCDMPQNDDTDKLVKDFIAALGIAFTTASVKVDSVVFNASRIARLPGCYNRKGANIPSQPQRMCRIIKVPDIITPTPIMSFAAISAQFAPAEEDNKKDNLPARNYDYQRRGDFDLEQWCAAHGINIVGKAKSADGTRYYLEHCLFNPEHAGKDAVLFRYDNGAIAYKCLHDTCNGFGWKDVRLKYEPNAYDHQEHQDFLYKNLRHLDKSQLRQLPTVQPPAPIQPTEEKGNVWLTMSSVALPSFDIKQYVPSGIEQIDRKIIGFKRKHVTVWSGYRGCGKSSLLNMLILNAADKSYNSALWTGELDCSEVKQWLYLQASGKQYNRPTSVEGYFYTPKNICEHIDPWIDKHFRLFNNEYGSNFTQIIDELRKLKETFDVDVAIFDNLMTLDLTGVPGDKYEQQDRLMVALTALAKELDIHIHIVAHPNKSGGFLRMNSVSGSGHITDLAQNVFIMHRVNKDFMTFAPEFLGADKVGAITSTGCTNCIEICKCRDKGSAVDTFIQLFFEKESNRLKDTEWESVNYGWSNVGQQQLSISAMMQNVNFDQQHGQYMDELDFTSNGDVPY